MNTSADIAKQVVAGLKRYYPTADTPADYDDIWASVETLVQERVRLHQKEIARAVEALDGAGFDDVMSVLNGLR